MQNRSPFDVYFSHSPKDRPVGLSLAERLRSDEVRVWPEEWGIGPGDDKLTKIEEGLEQSRVLVLCVSVNSFGSEWAQLETETLRFRDPSNEGHRFILLLLDHAPVRGFLTRFPFASWLPGDRVQAYTTLFETCRPHAMQIAKKATLPRGQVSEESFLINSTFDTRAFAFTPDGVVALSGGGDTYVRSRDRGTEIYLRVLESHPGGAFDVA